MGCDGGDKVWELALGASSKAQQTNIASGIRVIMARKSTTESQLVSRQAAASLVIEITSSSKTSHTGMRRNFAKLDHLL